MVVSEEHHDDQVKDDPIPGVDLPVWAEDIILFCGRILVRRFLFRKS